MEKRLQGREGVGRGVVFAVISPLASGLATVFQKGVVKEFGVLFTTALGQLIGGVLVLFISYFHSNKSPLGALRNNFALIMRITFIRGVVGGLLFVLGLYYTDAIKAVFFTKIEPYFVLFWCWALKGEKISGREVFLLLAHLLGAFLLSTGGDLSTISRAQLGDLFIVLSMAVSGYSYLDSRTASAKIGALRATGLTSLISGMIVLPLAFLLAPVPSLTASGDAWLMLLATVLFFYVIALTAWFESLKSVPAWLVSALRAIGPLAGAPAAYLLFGDILDSVQLFGGILVIGTSAWMVVQHNRPG